MDGYAASHRAVTKLKAAGTLPRRVQKRSCKYLNNVVEQDLAVVTIRGIELAEKIKKQQFNLIH